MRIKNYAAIREGLKLYDEANGRAIIVTSVDHFSDCVTAEVIEPEYNDEGEEVGETTETVLFTRAEICKFDIVEF